MKNIRLFFHTGLVVGAMLVSQISYGQPNPILTADEATVLIVVELSGDSPGIGSGVFVTNQGHILTNHHVVVDQEEVLWKNDDQLSAARVVWTEEDLDLALLKVDGSGRAPLSFPIDFSLISKGEDVFALGFPGTQFRNMDVLEERFEDLEPTVTKGVISRFSSGLVPMIQHTAMIRPGNSGGPLIDICGRIIGINSGVIGEDDTDYFSINSKIFVEQIKDRLGGLSFTPSCSQKSGLVQAESQVDDSGLKSLEGDDVSEPILPGQPITEARGASLSEPKDVDSSENRGILLLFFAIFFILCCVVYFLTGANRQNSSFHRKDLAKRPQKPLTTSSEFVLARLSGFSSEGNPFSFEIKDNSEMSCLGFTLGRDPRFSHFPIDSASVSRLHLRLLKKKNGLIVEDLNSTNGTSLNDNRLMPFSKTIIRPGDQLKLGDVVLLVSN